MKSLTKASGVIAGLVSILFSVQILAQAPETITVTSSAFDHHGTVPDEFSAYGDNKSIDLNWTNLPAGTVQLALICDDPIVVEIGMMPTPFVHWVAYNIPASASGLPAGMPTDAEVMGLDGLDGMINGLNGTRRSGYFGPRPPANGTLHAYHFRVYALDADLGLEAGLNKDELLAAVDGHVLATGLLMGHYERKE
ncbi:MAG: YbhB/YbcL family Raf kinase inhibitor-like protein [Proteobacteria bacterium]|nr:YbhB/YbcL family Raf kinase inhibitor-like protein [Pseudomonadota bacterium]